jgi:hypothetical protein
MSGTAKTRHNQEIQEFLDKEIAAMKLLKLIVGYN